MRQSIRSTLAMMLGITSAADECCRTVTSKSTQYCPRKVSRMECWRRGWRNYIFQPLQKGGEEVAVQVQED